MNHDELILRAEKLFAHYGTIVTGEGMTRKELRLLERKGLVERQMMQIKKTGAIINQWKPVSMSAGLIKK